MSEMKLEAEEKELLESYEADEWQPVDNLAEAKEAYSEYARATFKKDKRVNIRISSKDLEAIQKRALEAVEKMGDKDIDLSEIPEVTAEQMSRAKMRAGGKPVTRGKVRINMYLDAEIVEYFKTQAGGRGYQTLINQTLRESIRHQNLEEIVRRVIREELEELSGAE